MSLILALQLQYLWLPQSMIRRHTYPMHSINSLRTPRLIAYIHQQEAVGKRDCVARYVVVFQYLYSMKFKIHRNGTCSQISFVGIQHQSECQFRIDKDPTTIGQICFSTLKDSVFGEPTGSGTAGQSSIAE